MLNRAVLSGNTGDLVSKMMDIPGGNYVTNATTQTCEINKSRSAVVNYYPTPNFTTTPQPETQTATFCCNAEKKARQRVKPASTILKKNYFTTMQGRRQNRNKTYTQQALNFQPPAMTCNQPIYKPSNSKFATQGSVSSSLKILNTKVNAIETTASSLRSQMDKNTESNPFVLKMKTAPCSKASPFYKKTLCATYNQTCNEPVCG
tara:strand:- start:176 stop:790 length:615 start_codon:yes stop_codon:yes gene_type:complete